MNTINIELTAEEKLGLLRDAIRKSTYNVTSSQIHSESCGFSLAIALDLNTGEDLVDMIALNDLCNIYDCIIVTAYMRNSLLCFRIEERLKA